MDVGEAEQCSKSMVIYTYSKFCLSMTMHWLFIRRHLRRWSEPQHV